MRLTRFVLQFSISALLTGTLYAQTCPTGYVLSSGVCVQTTPALAPNATFTATGTGAVARTVASKLSDVVNVKDFGAVGDGSSHPLSGIYSTLASAQSVYPFVTALTQQVDFAAVQVGINILKARGGGTLYLPTGVYLMGADGLSYNQSSIVFATLKIVGDGMWSSSLSFSASATTIGLDICGTYRTTLADFQMTGSAGVALAMCRYGTSGSGQHQLSQFAVYGAWSQVGVYGIAVEETDMNHVYFRNSANAPTAYFGTANDLGVTFVNGTPVASTSVQNRVHSGSYIINSNAGASARGIVFSGPCNACSIDHSYISTTMAGVFETGVADAYTVSANLIGNELECAQTTEPAILFGNTRIISLRVADNIIAKLAGGTFPDIYQLDQTGNGEIQQSTFENNAYQINPSFYTAIAVRFLDNSNAAAAVHIRHTGFQNIYATTPIVDGGGSNTVSYPEATIVPISTANGGCGVSLAATGPGIVRQGSSGANCTVSGLTILEMNTTRAGARYSVAGTPLPACAAGTLLYQLPVSDATSDTQGTTYAGGGAITIQVQCVFNTAYKWIID